MRFPVIIIASLLSLACNAQPAKNNGVNKGENGFLLDVSFYKENNNIPKSAVILPDGFIVSGQKFTTQNSITQPSALVKVSPTGKIIKQEFIGNNGGFERMARLEYLLQIGKNRIVQIHFSDKVMVAAGPLH